MTLEEMMNLAVDNARHAIECLGLLHVPATWIVEEPGGRTQMYIAYSEQLDDVVTQLMVIFRETKVIRYVTIAETISFEFDKGDLVFDKSGGVAYARNKPISQKEVLSVVGVERGRVLGWDAEILPNEGGRKIGEMKTERVDVRGPMTEMLPTETRMQ